MKKIKKEKGITLVALIVTIVILLILAGISISSLSNTGIFGKAKEAQKVSENAEKEQKNILSEYEDEIYNNTSTSNVEKVSDSKPGELEINESNPNEYTINSIEDLVFFSYDVRNGNTYEGKTVKLGQDLDFNSSKSYVNSHRTDYEKYGYSGDLKQALETSGFEPIGVYEDDTWDFNNSFSGIFDGNEKIIYNLNIKKKIEDNKKFGIGLFAVNYGIIKNIELKNINIVISENTTFYGAIGGIAGINKKEKIINNCNVSGNIEVIESNGDYNLGGIIGSNSGECKKCFNEANICGTIINPNLSVIMEARIGGISGVNDKDGIIQDTYNTGNIYNKKNTKNQGARYFLSGLVGRNIKSILASYSIGRVINNSKYGRILINEITYGDQDSTIENSYYLKDSIINKTTNNISKQSNGIEKTEEEMKTDNFIQLLNKENKNIWKKDTKNQNNGYPIFE